MSNRAGRLRAPKARRASDPSRLRTYAWEQMTLIACSLYCKTSLLDDIVEGVSHLRLGDGEVEFDEVL